MHGNLAIIPGYGGNPRTSIRIRTDLMITRAGDLRGTLRSTGLVGGATIVALVFGLVRSKVIALTLGPAGIGLFGLLNTLLMSGVTIFGLNLTTSGVRALSVTLPESIERARAQAGLWSLTWCSAIIGGVAFAVSLRLVYVPIAGVPLSWAEIALLTVGLVSLIISGSQLAVLQTEGKVGAVAAIRLWSGVGAALLGVAATLVWHTTGVYVAILAIGLTAPAAALPYYLRGARPASARMTVRDHLRHWGGLLSIGIALTIGLFVTGAGQLAIRSVLIAQGSLAVAGEFQAATAVSSANMAIVLSALVVDYFPRLAASAEQPERMAVILADQVKVTMLLAVPLLILLAGFADLAVTVLFSGKFTLAAGLLRWLVIGDMLKILCWCVGYVVLARRSGAYFVAGETAFQLCSVGGTWLLYTRYGLPIVGISMVVGYAMVLVIYGAFAWRAGVRLDAVSLRLAICGAGLIVVTGLVAARHAYIAMVMAPAAALAFGGFAVFLFRDTVAVSRLLVRLGLQRWVGDHAPPPSTLS